MSVDKDLVSVQQARDLVEAAHRAQAQVAEFDQAKIDRICEAMARAALAEAARLGAMAVEETGYGVADDKREKNRFAAEDRSEEHTSELQSHSFISYAVF